MSGWRHRLLHGRPAQPSAELKRQFQSRDHTEHNTDLGTESQLLIRPRRRPLSLPSSVSAWLQPPWPPLPFLRLAPVSWPVHPFLSAQRACPRCPHFSPFQLLSHLTPPRRHHLGGVLCSTPLPFSYGSNCSPLGLPSPGCVSRLPEPILPVPGRTGTMSVGSHCLSRTQLTAQYTVEAQQVLNRDLWALMDEVSEFPES